ncbi:DUF4191 family protein [Nostocoides sp. F2B08]|uniref:DUF4191 domain-containing protein n=1 Tax=Nostocoides sp. F2B08 TaxID=2653936 RepID=UPI0012635CBD|nr:DUF4191 domain-containing protein [Tetrasphaera sp. F2B08]KAB7742492.1 DUF4191 family protein [Tetrasphaera sp. F2B08]
MALRRKKSTEAAASGSDAAAKKPGRIAQVRQGYRAIRQLDPNVGWFMLLAALVVLLVVMLIGWAIGRPWWALFFALPLMMIAALLVLNRRANSAMYNALDGKPGAAGAALTSIQRGWYTSQEPVAADVQNRQLDFTNAAVVFRALGRPGVVLVGEGPKPRVNKLLEAERKKVARVAPGVPVHLIVVGEDEGDVPVRKLVKTVTRKKPVLTKEEMAVVNKRLKSLPSIRDAVPAGIDPTKVRMSRKALRGR